MKTIIFDIDGTITNMWPIEKKVLLTMSKEITNEKLSKLKLSGINDLYEMFVRLSKRRIGKKEFYENYNKNFIKILRDNKLPKPEKFPIVNWIISNKNKYEFLYITGGQREETLYILRCLRLIDVFNTENSIDKSNCRYSKKTGIPFKIIVKRFKTCILITDSFSDCKGAKLANVTCVLIKPQVKNI